MEAAVTIGLDFGQSVFQGHGVDSQGMVVVQRRIVRARLLAFFAKQPACLVGMEACAAAHHWARELQKLGHRVKLMPLGRQTLRETAEERCCGCRGDLRNGYPPEHALR